MILYLFYNTDILETPNNQVSEDAISYVNDIALITIGDNLTETTTRLKNIMTRNEGGLEWSRSHNSKFEVNKSAIVHFSRKTILDTTNNTHILLPRTKLVLKGQTVKETKNYKYLGIIIDNQLTWKEQAQRLTANATSWILQFRRLTKPSSGIRPKLMCQLYKSEALPKITYGIDAWYTPPNKHDSHCKGLMGSRMILKTGSNS